MREVFRGSGGVGRDLERVDWLSTPLGDPDGWPRSLRAAVNILLTSRFAMWMAWGPELTFFCNDAYRRDTLGKKYPWALGRPAYEVWSEIWPDIGPRVDSVMRTGEATWDEALLLFLERSGYVEETYHTFSYSPLADDEGRIAGMLCVVSEDTERVIASRRIEVLQLLGSASAGVPGEFEGVATACAQLEHNARSIPFALAYLFDESGERAVLAGRAGVPSGHPIAPVEIVVGDHASPWPAAELAMGKPMLVKGLSARYPGVPTGAWAEPPEWAWLVPLMPQGQRRPYGFLVVGLNRYRQFDVGYRSFIDLVAGHITSVVTSARAYEAERRRAETLAALDKAKTDFFTNVSHEFRTPLTLMLGPAEDALADEHDPLTGRQARRVAVIHRNGQRLLKLVNTLLDFSQLESGRMEPHHEPVDLARHTAELASMFRSAAERLGLTFTVDCLPLSGPVYVDPEMWAKIVLNLLSNALKFTFVGGVTVRLAETDGRVELTVSDTGVGVDEAHLAHLFERFHRATDTRARTQEGSGIGLALVAELATLHGGQVSATSTPGEGTSFVVRLPLLRADLTEEHTAPGTAAPQPVEVQAEGFLAETTRWLDAEEPAAPAPEPRQALTTATRSTVLVADDNADMRDYIASLLVDEYAVETASDGMEALAKARKVVPDLVLTDVMMPNLDGFGLLAALKADPSTTGIPVVLVSARAGEEGVVVGLEAGADDYLVKPFTARELRARVRANLELDRARRTRTELERSRSLLDQAQRLAHVGSWQTNLATGNVSGSEELARIAGCPLAEIEAMGLHGAIDTLVHPDDRATIRDGLERAAAGELLKVELRLVRPDGSERLVRVRGERAVSGNGDQGSVHGSVQDITESRQAELELADAAVSRQIAEREHSIANELQRSLLPLRSFDLDHLEVATYYRAGVEGTQVGGDWYDVIELGAGRTALVIGDVMGRGVRAASVMGQLRSAVRAYARLDLPPADVLEFLDGIVRDLDPDQIVTCVYAVFDPNDRTLTFANAGHLPPLMVTLRRTTARLTEVAGPPLGAGPFTLHEQRVELKPGAMVVLYTDGLVERRGRDIDQGINALAARLADVELLLDDLPEWLVESLLPEGPDDDIALLVARVDPPTQTMSVSGRFHAEDQAASDARALVQDRMISWNVPREVADDMVLVTSELVTNALRHGKPPIELRLRNSSRELILEVDDRAVYRPQKLRPTPDDENGRGLQIVSLLASRWGTRSTPHGKSVWAILDLEPDGGLESALQTVTGL